MFQKHQNRHSICLASFYYYFPIPSNFIQTGIDHKPNDGTDIGDGHDEANNKEIVLRPIPIINTPTSASSNSINNAYEYDDTDDDGEHLEVATKTPILNKRLRNIQSMPFFSSCRPSSETDIFTISGNSMNQISMTPEIPSISYSTLPKHFVDTPTIEKYKESFSLYSIQTSNRDVGFDFSMPRYYGKGDMIAQSVDNLSTAKSPTQSMPSKKVEKSKRLKLIRANLPPLSIYINKAKSGERNIEWEWEWWNDEMIEEWRVIIFFLYL